MYKKIIEWFETNFPNYAEDMKNSNHHYDDITFDIDHINASKEEIEDYILTNYMDKLDLLNPYHMEGTVWTHTLMVCKEVEKEKNNLTEFEYNHLMLGALLHDLGKPEARFLKEEQRKTAFFNHENLSSVKAIDVLKKYNEDFVDNKVNIETVLLLINWHSDFHPIKPDDLSAKDKLLLDYKYQNQELFNLMVKMNKADNYGRIQQIEDKQVSKEKFDFLENYYPFKNNNKKDNFPLAIFLIGLPASGKTTLTNSELKDYEVFSTDKLITEKYPHLNYNDAFATVQSKDEFNQLEMIYFQNIKNACKLRNSFIVDRTHLTKKARRKVLSIVPDRYYKKVAYVFMTSETKLNEFALKRKKETGKFINEEIINSMKKNFNYPGLDEFDEVKYIVI